MDKLLKMKDCLMAEAHSQMGNLMMVDAKELGEVIDMIKDIEEAIYYKTITDAMIKNYGEPEHYYHYPPKEEHSSKMMESDRREGRSPKCRRVYMESKEMHHDKTKQMHELEQYLKELSSDIAEMIEDATPEEKTLLKTKLSNLVTRIA